MRKSVKNEFFPVIRVFKIDLCKNHSDMRATVKELLRLGLSPRELVEEAIKKLSPRCIRYFFDLFREKNEVTCEILTGFLKVVVTSRKEGMEGIIATFIKYGADPNRSSGNPFVRGMLDIPEDVYRHIFSFIVREPMIPLSAIPGVAFVASDKKLAYIQHVRSPRMQFSVMVNHKPKTVLRQDIRLSGTLIHCDSKLTYHRSCQKLVLYRERYIEYVRSPASRSLSW